MVRFSSAHGVLRAAALALVFLWLAPAIAQNRSLAVGARAPGSFNEQRLALVIGNADYREAPLRNSVNDATDIAQALRDLGFKVILRTNANQRQMKDAIREFGDGLLKGGGVGLFYFAGHGLQSRGRNFLVPIGAQIEREVHIEDEAVDVGLVLSHMDESKARVNLVVLDACRNNPFAQGRGTRSIPAGGLAQMEAATGTLIAFATAPGAVALDGEGRNGIYTKHLLAQMRQPGVPVELMFKRVRDGVMEDTGEKQIPWESSSLRGADFYFKIPAPPVQVVAPEPPAPPSMSALLAAEISFWESVKNSSDPAEFEAYLQKFPNGQFAALAQVRLAALRKLAFAAPPAGGIQPVSLAPTPLASPEPAPIAVAPAPSPQPSETASQPSSPPTPNASGPSPTPAPAEQTSAPAAPSSGSAPKPIPPQHAAVAAGSIKDCEHCPELVAVPRGKFVMGSVDDEAGRDPDEGPAHSVVLPKSFAVGKFEVTRAQFERFVQEAKYSPGPGCNVWSGKEWKNDITRDWRNPGFPQGPDEPVVCVSWNDAKAYAQWLTRKTGKRYRLPTEAEWEYVARAGTTTPFFWGAKAESGCKFANVADTTARKVFSTWAEAGCSDGFAFTAPVGRFQPNAFGLYDTAGNVWEWTEDCWNAAYSGLPSDGSAATAGDCSRRVLRGGSWSTYHRLARSAHRYGSLAVNRGAFNGFRIVRAD